MKAVVPALAVQSEYGFNAQPYFMQHGSSIQGKPGPPTEAPDPRREQKTGFDGWRAAGVDSMLVVPRASTHLEYTDIALRAAGKPLRAGAHERVRAALAQAVTCSTAARASWRPASGTSSRWTWVSGRRSR